jgi:UDP-glucose 4-epimerase
MKIMVIGGAGYIGSHFVRLAQESGHEVLVFDDFSTGHLWAIGSTRYVKGSLLDFGLLVDKLDDVDIVCHFAAKIVASESVANPGLYFRNNVDGTLSLLDAMAEAGCRRIVFSSTAAVYGNPPSGCPIRENCDLKPINPYGETKMIAEGHIRDWASKSERSATIFRYFNAAGAMPEQGLGEYHQPETHLIPNLLNALLKPEHYVFNLYGNDYSTYDGTCIRDYVHVRDIAKAHLDSLGREHLGCRTFNLGQGCGYSNLEVLKACEKAVGRTLDYVVMERRSGDPARLITDNGKALTELGWKPMYSDLDQIVADALAWHKDVLPRVVQ